MARRYKVEGTKAYLIAFIVFLAVAIWAIKDGWFPSDATLAKHPMEAGGSFYLFNKSLALICLIGAVVCGYIHLVVK